MPDLPEQAVAVITSKDDLIADLASGCKPREAWRIGTEHEKFAFHPGSHHPLGYEGPNGIRALLEGLTRFGWSPVMENGNPIALLAADNSSITLEPGGQVELSGAPLETIHQTCDEVGEHLKQVKEICQELDVGMFGLGYLPTSGLSDVTWMPKGRYAIMHDYMPTRGGLGLDMMLATCTVQVNLDFDSEARMIKMFRAALALQPLATALWANSPFRNGEPNGFLSYRSHIWTDTDPDRSGMLPFVFDDNFGFERWVDYMLDVPMYFVYRDGQYINAAGQSFRDFMSGSLPALPGERPTMKDWEDHLTTAFPEVRLKHFLEMRGADGGQWANLCALPAFWVGLLYDDIALDTVTSMIADWSLAEIEGMRNDVPKTALKTPFRGGTLQDIAKQVLKLARDGLQRRGRLSSAGEDETHYLRPLEQIAETGNCPAEDLLALYHGEWGGRVEPVFERNAY
jgi:glutamate--cysteine ligase